MTTPSKLLTVDNLSVHFKRDEHIVQAVDGLSFAVERGEMLAVVGESGSGKSVTARAIMRLLPRTATLGPDSRISFAGTRIDSATEGQMLGIRGKHIAMIFQEPMSSLDPIYRIGDQICEGIVRHQKLTKKQAMAQALSRLKEVQIPDPEARLQQYPHQLSGGQRQRVMIAIAIANNPELLIADEPTTALDVTVQAEILRLIRALQRSHNMGVIMITHDLTVVKRVSDAVCVMRLGKLRESNRTAALFASPQDGYTRTLLAAEPKGRPRPVPAERPVVLDVADARLDYVLSTGGFFSRRKGRTLAALDGISVQLRKGETLGVVGESGSGKSTLGKLILRLLDVRGSGSVVWCGEHLENKTREEMRPLRPKLQIVFQDPFSSMNPRLSVRQIVEEGLIVNGIGTSARDREARVCEALSDVGLDPNVLNRFPHEFSGGQRQRIAIARAVVLRPDFIVLDEPTSALDLSVQAQVIDLLRALQERYDLTYLFISHDLKVVRALCHNVVVMNRGRIVESGPTDTIMDHPTEDYTKRLVRAAFEVAA
ncbi:ABC transporter ATP-binding protein [Lichenifustis flavocetrariae]|uniref:ABC transporter ATP-binding protein n=1 Tax=Lichenifustis flavocetrariae TaxID=2949735 RepID=A0AA41YTG4_9HYPH|nr:ABC transporter ATP-binding protein [Lichenifustis flavocetrariae]MCW6508279.1 ABC transporter ATP-binding protein [Lichenifustis flavocetrariae]